MIEIKDLHKGWKEFSLKSINLEVKKGEYFVVLGPTGAGKTLLLELIAGFYSPDKGEIWIDGNEVTRLPPEKRKIGFVYQDYWLFPHFTVEENVSFGLRMKGMPEDEVRDRVREMMEFLGISHLSKRYPDTLSGGEQQKVAIARAVVIEPKVLLLDEPLSALDVRTRDRLRDELKQINRELETTVVHVTHDQTEAMVLADRVGVMMDGEIVQVGSVYEIFNRPLNERVAAFVGVENVLKGEIISWHEGMALVDTGGFEVIAVSEYREGDANLFIRPEDIVLSENPGKSSARNNIKGKIVDMINLGPVIRVELDNGLIALVTRQSAEELGLRIEKDVYASFKATAVHVVRQPTQKVH